MGLQNTENRYRMRQRNPLPKLRSNRNPFMARTETSSLPLHQPSTGTGTARPQDQEPATHDRTRRPAGPEAPQKTPAEAAAAALKKTAPLPATPSRSRAAGNVSSTAPIIASLSGIVSWMRKANPFARRSSPGPVSNAAVPEGIRPAVQGELSLDRIKVMRNDLNDADVEIVPAKAAVKPKPEPPARPGNKAELAPVGQGQ